MEMQKKNPYGFVEGYGYALGKAENFRIHRFPALSRV
jgi:hypothetical protein